LKIMPFYIILRDSSLLNEILGYSKTISLKIKKNLFISNQISKEFYNSLDESKPIVILKTSRSIERARIDYENEIYDLGSLTLVAYEPLKDTSGNRAIYRLISRAPCFKASTLTYLFPYIDYDKYINSRIVSPSMLIKKIIMYGGRVISASRLRLIYPKSGKMFIDDLTQSLMKRVEKLYEMTQKLSECERNRRIKYLKEVKNEIKILRELIKVYDVELAINLKTVTSKLINIAKTVNQLIEEAMEEE